MEGDMLYQNLSTNDSNRLFSVRQAQEEFKYYFLYVLFKRKWLIISTSIFSMIAIILGLYLTTPLYKGTSKILVRSNVSQEVMLFNDLYSRPSTIRNTMPANNFVEVATSSTIGREIVDQFSLDEKLKNKMENPEGFRQCFWSSLEHGKDYIKAAIKYPYNLYQKYVTGEVPVEEEKDYKSMAIKKFTKDMTAICLVPESDVINLTIWDDSPKEAEAIVKVLTELIIKQSVSMEQNAAGHGYEFAKNELAKARNELAVAEEQVQAFKKKWNISKIETQKEIKLSELDMVEKELISINAEIFSLKAKLAEGKKQLAQQKKSLSSLQAHRDLLNNMILFEVEISAFLAQKRHYEVTNAIIRNELSALVEKELELKQLKREARLKEDLFDKLGKKHDELNVQSISNFGGFNLRIIDTPELCETVKADYPIWDVGLGVGIPASIILAIILAFLLELQNESFWIGSQVENKLGIRLLGSIKFYETNIQKYGNKRTGRMANIS